MIRVLQYIGPLQFGGSQSFVMELYRKTDRNQVQFDFITFPGETSGNYEEIIALGGKVYECPQYSLKNHGAFCKWWHQFFREHPEYNPLHGHVRSCASVYMPIAKKYGCKTIVHSHSTSNGSGISSIVKAIYQYPIRYIADYLFSCSDIAGKWLYGKAATKRNNYYVIPNCVDLEYFAFSESIRKQVREEWNMKDDEFVIGHIGRFHESKNHGYILEIFKELLKIIPNSRMFLVGAGVKDGMEVMGAEPEVLEKMIFTGPQARPGRFYQAMDVFLFPSVWEGLPMSVVEAQAAGLPCHISDTITKNVLLTDLVQQHSIKEKPEYWAKLMAEHKQITRMALAKENIECLKKFDSKVVAEQLQNFYIELCEGR